MSLITSCGRVSRDEFWVTFSSHEQFESQVSTQTAADNPLVFFVVFVASPCGTHSHPKLVNLRTFVSVLDISYTPDFVFLIVHPKSREIICRDQSPHDQCRHERRHRDGVCLDVP